MEGGLSGAGQTAATCGENYSLPSMNRPRVRQMRDRHKIKRGTVKEARGRGYRDLSA